MSTRLPTEEEVNAAKSAKGGWSKETLAGWGISWPPPKGWRQQLVADSKRAIRTSETKR